MKTLDSQFTKAANVFAARADFDSDLEKKITAASPTIEAVTNSAIAKLDDSEAMKISPRELIGSLEKLTALDPEQLIGKENLIDLEGIDLEPVAKQVRQIPGIAKAKTHKVIDAQKLDPPTALGTDTALEDADTTEPVIVGSEPAANDLPVQPLGLSFFERFAFGTMLASESHLASLAMSGDEPETQPVSTIAPREEELELDVTRIEAPVVIEDSSAVERVRNEIPPTHVSPGLDEMVISATSQTDFDLNDSEMVFSGNVQVKSPRFNLRADKFIVHLKKDNSGMAFGEAIGDVVIEMRENGRPTGYSGLASNAVYHPGEGKITLSGWPKIRQQYKEHVAITRDTKMVLYTDGRVKTLGRNRTIIRK